MIAVTRGEGDVKAVQAKFDGDDEVGSPHRVAASPPGSSCETWAALQSTARRGNRVSSSHNLRRNHVPCSGRAAHLPHDVCGGGFVDARRIRRRLGAWRMQWSGSAYRRCVHTVRVAACHCRARAGQHIDTWTRQLTTRWHVRVPPLFARVKQTQVNA